MVTFGIHKDMLFIHIEVVNLRTNIEIDDRLMKAAMRDSRASTKKDTVEAALRLLTATHNQGSIRRLRGKVRWHGNLEVSRRDRVRG
jgi:Arc/MetJ family transcription regulator